MRGEWGQIHRGRRLSSPHQSVGATRVDDMKATYAKCLDEKVAQSTLQIGAPIQLSNQIHSRTHPSNN